MFGFEKLDTWNSPIDFTGDRLARMLSALGIGDQVSAGIINPSTLLSQPSTLP